MNIQQIKALRSEWSYDRQEEDKIFEFVKEKNLKAYQILLDYGKANKHKILKREKRNNAILGTNHIAEKLKVLNGVTYVKGEITHGREQHTKFILDTWHIALKNLVVNSWQIDRRSGGGAD